MLTQLDFCGMSRYKKNHFCDKIREEIVWNEFYSGIFNFSKSDKLKGKLLFQWNFS